MLIKFFPNGKGGGAGPVDYLTARTVLAYDESRDLIRDANGQPQQVTRDPLPEVLSGDPQIITDLIDACPHKWSYRAGVISFATDDAPTEDQQQEVIDRFEELAFAGLEGDQYSCLWVRHTHEDRVELHFCAPRMELHSGRSLNIAPPGYQRAIDSMRDLLNKAHGWADPMDASRRQDVRLIPEAPHKAKGREALHDWAMDQVSLGLLNNRDDIITAFSDAGFELPRVGKNYITVKDPESSERWRLRGEIFNEDWTAETTLERTTDFGDRGEGREPSRLDGWSSEELIERYRTHCDKRADYNRKRYCAGRERNHVEHEPPIQTGSASRDAVASDDLLSVWSVDCAGDRDGIGGHGNGEDVQVHQPWDHNDPRGGSDLPDLRSIAQPDDELHSRGSGAALHSNREGIADGWPDSTRTRIAQIRGAVDRSIRDLSEGLGKLGAAMGASDEQSRDWIGGMRQRASAFARSIGRCLTMLDGRRAELGIGQRQAEREHSSYETRRVAAEERLAEVESESGYDFGL